MTPELIGALCCLLLKGSFFIFALHVLRQVSPDALLHSFLLYDYS